MVRLRAPFGFPTHHGCRFRLGGRRYYVGSRGIRTLRLLAEFHDSWSTCADRSWPFRLRNQIRKAPTISARSVLSLVVERTADPTLRVLAIWLRGRCGGSLGTASLAKFSTHPDDQTRKEVARALKRMGAWVQLRPMAECDPNPRIRRIATIQASRAYGLRLTDFSSHFPKREVRSVQRELVVAPELDLSQGRPPKPRWVIRGILERIHHLVGGHSRGRPSPVLRPDNPSIQRSRD